MQISVESNIREVLSEFQRISHVSVQYAISYAINDTLFDLRNSLPNEIEEVFDKPVPFTTTPNAWEISKSRTQSLEGAIRMRPMQAEYMKFQVYGGTEQPKKKAIPVPSAKGSMRASHGGLKKSWKAAFGNDRRYFSGIPKQASGGGGNIKPVPGLYRRYGKSKWNKRLQKHTGGYLKLQVSFETETQYGQRWDFHAFAAGYFQTQFEDNFRRRMREQIARRS